VKKISFGLLELEMADLERFWRKTPLGPLGVKLDFILMGNKVDGLFHVRFGMKPVVKS
jgi:hypothetical protein